MRVELTGITKRFGNVKAVDDVTLTIGEGDFFTLLGPSGCGKTTLLRMIAGFYTPDAGEIRFDGRRVNDVPPHRRETGMVFQNYALFPHLSVFDNIAYGLRARKVPRREAKSRIGAIIESVQLDGLEDRPPSKLSGGQQQRVALARALVISPQILLMDEPLSNLDAKLRVSMREEIRRLQRRLGITTIYVTHDQEEAMAVSDRIAILNRGRLEQLGEPAEIYYRPQSRFAAEFMGASNIIEMDVVGFDPDASLIAAETGGYRLHIRGERPADGRIALTVRPEWIRVVDEPAADKMNVFSGTVLSSTFLGSMVRYRVSGPGGATLAIEFHDPEAKGIRGNGEILWYHIPPDRPVVLRA
ncbi:MAG TPA: spermidine/putrescine ABC transporter ATP-binding protein [Syntrophus sp. (in: bacteria)]|nr:spermidine/putrescine ABC transporter ATP-binding protein [Syntrophus sp. (in: bacteria)]